MQNKSKIPLQAIARIGIVLVILFGFYLMSHREFVKPVLISFLTFLLLLVCARIYRNIFRKKHIIKIHKEIKEKGLEQYIINFLNRFSFESNKIKGWTFRNRRIDWDRIHDLEKYLVEQDINLETGKEGDIYIILKNYIQEKESKLTTESISKEAQSFTKLSGTEFEKLLYRLFEKMGYTVELIGKSGDQGGDLIANKNGGRVLIQAKCYRDWSTGNDAVQQVVGAMKYYDCNKAMVITTSYFTQEAIALAKANNTELISKTRLQELLLEHLQESWG